MDLRCKPLIMIAAVALLLVGFYSIGVQRHTYMQIGTVVVNASRADGTMLAVFTLLIMIVPILKIVGAIGLLRDRTWGWLTAVIALALDLGVRAVAVVRLHTYTAGDIGGPPAGRQGIIVASSSAWPLYVILAISVISLFLLLGHAARRPYDRPAGDDPSA